MSLFTFGFCSSCLSKDQMDSLVKKLEMLSFFLVYQLFPRETKNLRNKGTKKAHLDGGFGCSSLGNSYLLHQTMRDTKKRGNSTLINQINCWKINSLLLVLCFIFANMQLVLSFLLVYIQYSRNFFASIVGDIYYSCNTFASLL